MITTDATLMGRPGAPRSEPGVLSRIQKLLRLAAQLLVFRARGVLGVVSPAGWITALLGLSMTFVGVAAGWVEFLVLGAAFLGTLAGCALFLVGRSNYEMSLGVDRRHMSVGDADPATVSVAVRNLGPGVRLPSKIEVSYGVAGREPFYLPRLRPGDEPIEFDFTIPASRRGVVTVGPVLTVRGDPLGMLRRTLSWLEPQELFVRPEIRRVRPAIIGRAHDLEGLETAIVTADDLTFHALRDYVPGDDQRHIHWRSSARRMGVAGEDAYQVRQFQETRRSQVTLLLPEDSSYYASEEEFELAVSTFASVGVQAIASGAAAAAVTETRTVRSVTAAVFLEDSCRLLYQAPSGGTFRTLLRRALRRGSTPDVLVVVVGSGATDAQLREVGILASTASSVVAMRAHLGEDPTSKRLGDVLSLTIGTLDDLPRALRKARLG